MAAYRSTPRTHLIPNAAPGSNDVRWRHPVKAPCTSPQDTRGAVTKKRLRKHAGDLALPRMFFCLSVLPDMRMFLFFWARQCGPIARSRPGPLCDGSRGLRGRLHLRARVLVRTQIPSMHTLHTHTHAQKYRERERERARAREREREREREIERVGK